MAQLFAQTPQPAPPPIAVGGDGFDLFDQDGSVDIGDIWGLFSDDIPAWEDGDDAFAVFMSEQGLPGATAPARPKPTQTLADLAQAIRDASDRLEKADPPPPPSRHALSLSAPARRGPARRAAPALDLFGLMALVPQPEVAHVAPIPAVGSGPRFPDASLFAPAPAKTSKRRKAKDLPAEGVAPVAVVESGTPPLPAARLLDEARALALRGAPGSMPLPADVPPLVPVQAVPSPVGAKKKAKSAPKESSLDASGGAQTAPSFALFDLLGTLPPARAAVEAVTLPAVQDAPPPPLPPLAPSPRPSASDVAAPAVLAVPTAARGLEHAPTLRPTFAVDAVDAGAGGAVALQGVPPSLEIAVPTAAPSPSAPVALPSRPDGGGTMAQPPVPAAPTPLARPMPARSRTAMVAAAIPAPSASPPAFPPVSPPVSPPAPAPTSAAVPGMGPSSPVPSPPTRDVAPATGVSATPLPHVERAPEPSAPDAPADGAKEGRAEAAAIKAAPQGQAPAPAPASRVPAAPGPVPAPRPPAGPGVRAVAPFPEGDADRIDFTSSLSAPTGPAPAPKARPSAPSGAAKPVPVPAAPSVRPAVSPAPRAPVVPAPRPSAPSPSSGPTQGKAPVPPASPAPSGAVKQASGVGAPRPVASPVGRPAAPASQAVKAAGTAGVGRPSPEASGWPKKRPPDAPKPIRPGGAIPLAPIPVGTKEEDVVDFFASEDDWWDEEEE